MPVCENAQQHWREREREKKKKKDSRHDKYDEEEVRQGGVEEQVQGKEGVGEVAKVQEVVVVLAGVVVDEAQHQELRACARHPP